MKISAIYDDNAVYVDGIVRTVTWSKAMPDNWYALQWNGNVGHLEFQDDTPNMRLDTPALALLCKAAWDNGLPPGRAEAVVETDVLAQARAAVLDQMVLEAAGKPGADPLMVAAAAKLAEQAANTAALEAKV